MDEILRVIHDQIKELQDKADESANDRDECKKVSGKNYGFQYFDGRVASYHEAINKLKTVENIVREKQNQ